MATFKCKMCDAVLNVREGTSICVCEYCGTRQTVTIDGDDIAMFSNTDHRENVHSKENDSVSAEPLLKRAFLFLKDGDWGQAKVYCERALDIDPENGRAYLGKLMADVRVINETDLAEIAVDYRFYNIFEKAIRFGDPQMVKKLNDYSVEAAYKLAVELMDKAVFENDCRQAAEQFRSVKGYKDANELARKCEELAKEKETETERKRYEDEIDKEKNGRRKLICIAFLAIPMFLIFPTLFSSFYDPFIVTFFLMSIMLITTFFGIFICCYFNWIININSQLFWFFSIVNNVIIPYLINIVLSSISFGKAFIFMSVCSLISGFIGDRLGKRKAEQD